MDFDTVKDYKYILDKFGKETVSDRCDWLKSSMEEFIIHEGLGDRVSISDNVLFHVIIDYYVDIDRLKEFQHIEITNKKKIFAYLTYWVLRHKPIQIRGDISEEHVFVNEQFCTELLRCFLFDKPSDVPILAEKADDINEFIETMFYYFKYRDYSARSIEFMLIAFEAGRGYQYSVDNQR